MKNQVIVDKSLPKNLPLLMKDRAWNYSDYVCQIAKDKSGKFVEYSYKEVYADVLAFAIALQEIGVKRGSHVGLISDNRKEWLITDLALLSLGAADVPRGCDTMSTEVCYILDYADCLHSFFENERQLDKLLINADMAKNVKTAILFDAPSEHILSKAKTLGVKVYTYEELLSLGKKIAFDNPNRKARVEAEMELTDGDEICTLIFTSGTTGTPKGVMLTHKNFLVQLEVMGYVLPMKEKDRYLSVLPVWHIFERIFQYIPMTLKSALCYSKPAAPIMLPDMAVLKPNMMCGVPRVWEALATGINKAMKKEGGFKFAMFKFFVGVGKKYSKMKELLTGLVCRFKPRSRVLDVIVSVIPFILLWPLDKLGDKLVFSKVRGKFGGNLNHIISGGGALQKDIDIFYRAINMTVIEGYGMTETAPVLTLRDYRKPRPGCVGVLMPCISAKIVKEEHGKILDKKPLPAGKRGIIMVKGEQIMKGYYKRPDLTAEIIDEEGWLNTGDLGMMTLDNEIKITGRAKDTIVLLGGENVEPLVVESALKSSDYIEAAVVLGQDKKYLGALIVPDHDAIEGYAKENGINFADYETLLETSEIKNLIRSEIDNKVNAENGFRTCERIYSFCILSESFKIGEELSGKQEYMRHKINAKYKKKIELLFQDK
ncbi:MAG: long-chain fatty acid--CoA ligase [Treponemataceae bacterium]|nr:long-chain fatty acid--CoA ligase [Treponemataceae bacterium]